MSIPEYLASTYRYTEASVAGTGQDVIDATVPELVASGFTDQGGGWYKSPVDAAGRFFSVLMTPMPDGVTANLVQLDVKDQAGRLVMQRRAYCNATANLLRIYTGSHHFICDMGNGSGYEAIAAGMLDASPFSQGGAMDRYVWGNATRRTNNDTYYGSSAYACMLDNTSWNAVTRINQGTTAGGNGSIKKTLSGRWIYRPLELFAQTASVNKAWAGRMYQIVSVASDFNSPGQLLTLPIDAGVNGQFRVIWGIGSGYAKRWACRVA